MNNIFTVEEINNLSATIDNQLRELRGELDSGQKRGATETPDSLPVKQSQAIAEITQEKPPSFLKKFARAAKCDLCDDGGILHTQWKKWADLNNQEVIEKFGAVLVTLGFSGGALEILVVALAVIVIHIGVKAFCEEYAQ
ncbi:MAG: hypothetical protein QNJ63_12255 [Calothrix sp. MO_192.B10]|nr:hypothetical protein [Calothrix sp. MO_192.B10]